MRSWFVRLFFAVSVAAAVGGVSVAHAASDAAQRLEQLAAGPHRVADNKARDGARHPAAVLSFFGVASTARVIEILPGKDGYWTEILAPYLRDYGHYVAALPKPNPANAEVTQSIAGFKAKLAADPIYYSRVSTIDFASAEPDLGAPGSADVVLTFRNLHNWMAAERADAVLAAMYNVLRSGGTLGIVEHRGAATAPQDPKAKSGYVRQDYAVQLIEKAGFKFKGSSEIDANPRDTKDYPAGVWALPPTYRLKDQDRAKYAAIGESDRFVLRFVKP